MVSPGGSLEHPKFPTFSLFFVFFFFYKQIALSGLFAKSLPLFMKIFMISLVKHLQEFVLTSLSNAKALSI